VRPGVHPAAARAATTPVAGARADVKSAMVPDPPRVVGLDAGAPALARPLAAPPRPAVVGITGPVGSGKSTLAAMLERAHDAVVLSTDRYLPEYHDTPEDQRDRPEHADLERLDRDLARLADGKPAEVPVWSFHTHRREGEEPIGPAGLVVCEGLHALDPAVRRRHHMRVVVTAPPETRASRWAEMAERGDRGWSVEQTTRFFHAVADPVFAERLDDVLAAAHLLVENPGEPAA